jgi:hypothetical protein
MDQLQALKKLAAKVEAGDDRFSSFLPIEHEKDWPLFYKAFNGSLDTAKALHEVTLPGWGWQHGNQIVTGRPSACVYRSAPEDADWIVHHITADNTARAWLLAILRAKINELEEV